MTQFRIALAQINPTVGDFKGNADKIVSSIERARAAMVDGIGEKAADLVLAA